MLQQLKAPKLPFRELDLLVKAIGECRSKQEEDRIIAAEVDTLKQRLSDPRLDKTRGREYMVRVIYCEMLGHDASFAYIPALQLASDPNLLTKKAAYLALTQLLDYKHELVLLLVNTLLSDLKSDNFVVVASALVVTSKLIGPDLVNAVLPLVIERLSHPRESVRKKAVMALLHFHQMDPDRSGPLAGVELERLFRTALCDKEPSVMAAAVNALQALAAANPAPFRQLIPSLTSILKQVVEHRLPKAYDYHRFPAPFIQIKLLKLLRLLGTGDKAASDNMAAVVAATLRRAAAGGSHTIGHAIVYEAVRTVTDIYPNPQLLAAAAEAVAGLIKSSSHNLKYCGLTALAAITRVSPKYAQEHQVAVIDCLEDPDETLKLKTLELLVTMTKANNVQVVVERLMAFLRSSACGGDELLRRHISGQVVDLAEKYAPDTTWFVGVMAEVFEVGGDVLQPQLAHNLCRLIAEQDGELHATAVRMFMQILDNGTTSSGGSAAAAGLGGGAAAAAAAAGSAKGGLLPEILLCCICWALGEYGSLAAQLPPPHRASIGQVADKLCAAVACAQPSPTTRAYLLTAITKLAARQLVEQGGQGSGVLRPEAQDLLAKAGSSSLVELQQRAREAAALLKLPPVVLSAVLPFDGSCEELEQPELDEARSLSFLDSHISQAIAAGAQPYNPPPELCRELGGLDAEDLDALGLATAAAAANAQRSQQGPLGPE
ncbi:ARM repeat-containing protein [Scenedesmus sp. NREL 46B-D3]|nr:ARM repeat-containing protein [Scenedesmus sp. NREL 46B-D3]